MLVPMSQANTSQKSMPPAHTSDRAQTYISTAAAGVVQNCKQISVVAGTELSVLTYLLQCNCRCFVLKSASKTGKQQKQDTPHSVSSLLNTTRWVLLCVHN